MEDQSLKQRHPPPSAIALSTKQERHPPHPAGNVKHGAVRQTLSMLLFALYFAGSVFAIAITQYVGCPLYFYDRSLFYSWMAMTKQHFGVVAVNMTYWWAPVKMRISGDESVRGQIRKTKDGRLECDFPERMLLISNHQIYTDWIYLWWISYASEMHGHLFIILKQSIKFIPLLGTGMMLWGFIFLSRKWATDKQRFQHRLKKLSTSYRESVSGTRPLDPMWLLIFPEGTNWSRNGHAASKKWAMKNNMEDLKHALLPRSTGLLFCLQELQGTLEYVYDCTLAYEGVPAGQYGQDVFTLRGTYFQGRPPKSVNMHWRRFRIADIPTHDEKAFGDWLLARWREKDVLLQHFADNQRFPADHGLTPSISGGEPLRGAGWVETEVRPTNPLEFLKIFVPAATLALLLSIVLKMKTMALTLLKVNELASY